MKKSLLVAAGLLAGFLASAGAQTTASVRWELRVKDTATSLGTFTTQTLCDAAARARNITAVYECPRLLSVTGTAPPPVCDPAPAPTVATNSRPCASGETGGPVVTTVTTTYTRGPAPACAVASTSATVITGACTPVVTPPTSGPVLYLSDCIEGAAAGCVAGNDSAPGTQAQPKRTLQGANVNALPRGARVLLARGGAWNLANLGLENLNVTVAEPLVFDAYGSGPAPLLRTTDGSNGINIGGRWGNTSDDGGYTLRNVKLDGGASGAWGIWLVQRVRGVTLENVEITNYSIGIHSSDALVSGLKITGSNISRNRAMGILGAYSEATIDGNTFEGNNASGSNGNHAIYFSNGRNVKIRGNTFDLNSVVNGRCTGGNVTVHGVVDGLEISGNTIRQNAADPSCYGIAVTSGYTSVESFRNVVIRGNTIVGIPFAAIAANAAPGIVVEGNILKRVGASAITIPANNGPDPDDARDADAIVRGNTLCSAGSTPATISVNVPGAAISGNVVRSGADATTGACQ